MTMVSMITDPNLVDDSGYIYIADSDIKTNKVVESKNIYEEQNI